MSPSSSTSFFSVNAGGSPYTDATLRFLSLLVGHRSAHHSGAQNRAKTPIITKISGMRCSKDMRLWPVISMRRFERGAVVLAGRDSNGGV